MFGRVAVRATKAARFAGPSRIARAAFTEGGKGPHIEVISKNEIDSVSFDGGEAKSSTLKVGDKSNHDPSRVIPLSQETFRTMTPTMQKSSIMGKVVVVTGYVLMPFPQVFSGPLLTSSPIAVLVDLETTWLGLVLRQAQKQ